MKRYWLFTFPTFYPSGGMDDFVNSYDTAEEAIQAAKRSTRPNRQVVDSHSGQVLFRHEGPPY